MIDDPFFGAYETRLIVLLENDTYDGFQQVFLDKAQFKKVSDAIIREIVPDDNKPGMETVRIELSEQVIPPTLFEGMNSVNPI